MSTEARIKIDSHRLMRKSEDPEHVVRVNAAQNEVTARKAEERRAFKKRVWVHAGIFAISFIFTTGVSVLSVLLWVRPDALTALVVVGIFSSLVFVATFASLRLFVLHILFNEHGGEDDPGMTHHATKSIAYGFVALVGAVFIAGFIINVAAAFS